MNAKSEIEQRVVRHYAQGGLENTILAALTAAGKNIDQLTSEDLSPVDEFHTGGRQATSGFAEQLDFAPDASILDVGCGLGGPSRYFAEKCACRVTGIDLTPEYVQTATALARRLGLSDRVTYRVASALALPFDANEFDGAYMIHVGMNIQDKGGLFREIRRVLKPGTKFGIYDVVHTGKAPLTYPLPCALTPETSFVAAAEVYRRELEAAGFEIEDERDHLALAQQFFRAEMAKADASAGPPPLGVHILLKQDAPKILANVRRLFEAGAIAPMEFFCRAR